MTSIANSRAYVSPGPGTWEQDSTHVPRPMTSLMFEAFREPFAKGFREGTARYGLLFNYLEPAQVNNFVYYRKCGVDPENQEEVGRRFEAARKALESKLWFEDLDRWDREYKPDSIERNRKLEAVVVDRLDTQQFIEHLVAARDNAAEMVYRHHIFTIPAVIPTGRYLASAAEWTGLDAHVLLAPLKGSSPVSLGAHDELLEVGAALTESAIGPASFSESAAATLAALQQRQDRLGAAVRAYLHAIGLRLAGGYDIADPCAVDLPEMLLGSIWASKAEMKRAGSDEAAVTRVRDLVPSQHREQFDELLATARRMNRLRDERGIYNDTWGTGILRRAVLESGRRLSAAGVIDMADNALDLTMDEHVTMLRGGQGPAKSEVSERTAWRRTASLADVPPILGEPPVAPPPLDGLPPHVKEMMRAFGTALGELFTPAPETPGATIAGKPVSPGVYIGTARIVHHPEEFDRLRKGDVLVTASTSPAFNVVLPLLGAIVTDRGGQLSHAAIVAREYGIPAVVGTLKATNFIKDGDRVKVDGSTGLVEVM